MIISPADPNCVKYWILGLLFFSTFDNVLLFCKKPQYFLVSIFIPWLMS